MSSRVERLAVAVRRAFAVVVLMVAASAGALAQGQGASSGSAADKKAAILPHVRAWRMIDDYTLADTVVVDTIVAEHQVHNPIWRKSLSNVTLGNLGSPAISTFYPAIARDRGNVFYNSLKLLTFEPEDFTFYNTVTPYSNLTYQRGIPKRRAEEFFSVLFTQNVNRRLNLGMRLDLTSAKGRYEGQGVYNRKFGFWGSYDGDYYHAYMAGWYQRFDIEENGGILNDSIVMYPDSFDYDNADDIPVQFMNSYNRTASYRFLYGHGLDIGSVTRTEGDSIEYDVPVASVNHKFYIDKSHHEFHITDLSVYSELADQLFPNILVDPYATSDSRKYMLVSNLFQLKMNEEFNNLLRFGLRLYVGNDIRQYYWDAPSTVELDEDENIVINYFRNKETKVSTYLGGQIFKNIGDHLKWNAGLRFVAQGYDVGDIDASGNVEVGFDIGSLRTELWGQAKFMLRSPTVWEDKFTCNHYTWSQSLDDEQSLDIRGGLRMPTIDLDINVFSATLNNRVYFSSDGVPSQKSSVTQILGVYARKHFASRVGFNSIVRLAVQKTSDNDVVPLPSFALYSSCYWERKFFGVLVTQIGFDVRYNTSYNTPAYIPSLMQFVPQHERKVGGYGYFDPYVNFHLKKIRAYAKYEHINNFWGSNDYFNTIHYPANPGTFKFGLSWNFYD